MTNYAYDGNPTELKTLSGIAAALGVPDIEIHQHAARIDAAVASQQRGARRVYPIGAVVDVLNATRHGHGPR